MKKSVCIFLLFVFTGWLNTSVSSAQTEYIRIISNQEMDTNTAFMQGFINGGASYNIPLTQKLRPAFWGFGWDVQADYDYAVPNFNLTKMASIYSAYMRYYGIGDPLLLQPWTDGYVQWDNFVTALVNQSISTGRPVDFWSVWGEPDATFSGTPAQYIELFRRTDSLIHAVDSAANLVGPDLIHFGIAQLLYVIDTLHALNIHPAAISWHEFGNAPEDIYLHVQQFRDSLVSRPFLDPEIHIQEYAGPDNRLVPGWAAGWLYYFEKSKVDWVSRGCFDEYDGVTVWDDCWDGLSGMYMSDGATPQPLYWVHRAYAELESGSRVTVQTSQPRTVALAGKNDADQELKIVAGRYYSTFQGFPAAAADVHITIRNYPYGSNTTVPLVILKIPAQSVNYSVPLAAPVPVFTGSVSFTGDSAEVVLNAFADGDVYVVYINPAPGSLLSSGEENTQASVAPVSIWPNPSQGTVFLEGLAGYHTLEIADQPGRVVYRTSLNQSSFQLHLPGIQPGMYFIRVGNADTWVVKKWMVQ